MSALEEQNEICWQTSQADRRERVLQRTRSKKDAKGTGISTKILRYWTLECKEIRLSHEVSPGRLSGTGSIMPNNVNLNAVR